MSKVWKSIDKIPDKWINIAAVDQDDDFVLCYYGDDEYHYRGGVGTFKPKKWAYLKDLMSID